MKSQQIQMVTMLQTLETDDGMRSGSFAMVAKCFSMARSTVYRLWNRVVCMRAHGHIISPEFQSHKKNCGRPPIYPSEFVREGIKNKQVTDPKKADGVVGGVKDDGATLDC